MKIALLFTNLIILSTAVDFEDNRHFFSDMNIFDKDSEFIRGFETGILVRSKGSSMEEFGCEQAVNTEINETIQQILSTVEMGVQTVKSMMPDLDSNVISMVVSMLTEYLIGVVGLINAIISTEMDMYCRGMVFGLQGSKLLVTIANLVTSMSSVEVDAAPAKRSKKGKKKSGGDFLNQAGKFFEKMAGGVLNKDSFKTEM